MAKNAKFSWICIVPPGLRSLGSMQKSITGPDVAAARLTVEILNGMVRSVDGSITEIAAASPQPVAPHVPYPFDLVPTASSAR